MTTTARLKLQANSHDDLTFISTCLQDAIMPSTAMGYYPDEHMFAVMMNRFMWEQSPEKHEEKIMHKRVHSGLYFCNIHHVEHQNINTKDDQEFLSLLSIQPNQEGNIHLIFSGNKQVCLHTNDLQCYLKDLHDPWHTEHKPGHI